MSPVPPSVVPPAKPTGPGGARPAKGTGKLPNGMRIKPVKTQAPPLQNIAKDEGKLAIAGTLRQLFKKKEKKEKTSAREAVQKSTEKKERLIEEAKSVDDAAEKMAKKHPDFESDVFEQLCNSLIAKDSSAAIKNKALKAYKNDPTLAEDALAYLEQVSDDNLKAKVKEARILLKEAQPREIKAGRNIQGPVTNFGKDHKEVKQSPNALRTLYRAVTGKPWTPNELYAQLFKNFPFEHLVFIFGFLFDALGAELRLTADASIPKPQLRKRVKDIKNVQAIFGVYRFFKGSLRSIKASFKKYHILLPKAVKQAGKIGNK